MVEVVKVAVEVQSRDRVHQEVLGQPLEANKHPTKAWVPQELAARDQLVAEYLPLVHRLCRKFIHSGEPFDDLVQVGSIGLLKAIEKFDATRGFKLSTYAVPVIVGEIKNYLRDHGWAVRVPRKLQMQKLAVQRSVDSLSQSLSRAPTVQEITLDTRLSQEEVYDTFEVGNFGKPLSLEAEYGEEGEKDASTLLDYLGSEDPRFAWLNTRIDLAKTITCLTPREKTIIYLKFYAGLSQMEIAKRLGISQMHVSRLQRSALGKLKHDLMK